MDSDGKPRHEASGALVSLRKRMGLTQTTFAVDILKCAISTLGRYETSTPPPVEVLLQLWGIAGRADFFDLQQRFLILYLDAVLAGQAQKTPEPFERFLGMLRTTGNSTGDDPGTTSYLVCKLKPRELAAAYSFLSLLSVSEFDDVESARLALNALSEAARTCGVKVPDFTGGNWWVELFCTRKSPTEPNANEGSGS